MIFKTSGFHGIVACALLSAAQCASAGVINFEELNGEAELEGLESAYTTQGFTFTYAPAPGEPYPTSWHSVGPSYQFNDGTTALVCNSDNATCSIKHRKGRPFAFLAIDLAELNGAGVETSVTFVGTTRSGKQVTHTVTLDNVTGFERFFLPPSFRNLIDVRWQQGDNATNGTHFMDNVVMVLSDFRPAL